MKKPGADECFETAMMLVNQGNRVGALNQFEAAIFARPDFAAAYCNRGNALHNLGNVFDAWMCYQKACELAPNVPEFHQNRGAALSDLGQLEAALAAYDSSLVLRPTSEHVWANKGNALRGLGRIAEAADCYRKSMALNPDYPDAHLNLAMALLQLGEWQEGWREYEWRWKVDQIIKREMPYPEWTGKFSPDALLICAEQGMGDAIQFMRYAPLVRKRWGCKVYIEVRQSLVRLMRSLGGVDGVVAFGDPPPDDVTHWVPMMSLPGICGTRADRVPVPDGGTYLRVSPWRAQQWQRNLSALPPGRRIGLCWAGGKRVGQPNAVAVDRRRSLQIAQLAPLARVPGCAWVSLQCGPPGEQITSQAHGLTIGDWTDEFDDFYDTAALITNLDLVITVDTAVAHLAAALGKPTWMLSRFDGCWRWMQDRTDTPWYPTMRIFRQPEPGDWDSVINEVAQELDRLTETRNEERAYG